MKYSPCKPQILNPRSFLLFKVEGENPVARIYNVAVIVFPEVEELDFAGVWEALAATQHLAREEHFFEPNCLRHV